LSVLLLSAEDGAADTIRPRFDAAGGDPARCTLLTGMTRADGTRDLFSLSQDIEALERAAAETRAALIIIDPLTAYVGKADTHKDQEIRRVLAALAAAAERTNSAIVLVRHLNKSASSNVLYRGGGSIGIIGAARLGLLVSRDPDNPERRLLATSKSNLGRPAPTLAFSIEGSEPNPDVPVIAWEAVADSRSAEELMAAASEPYEERSATGEARRFLKEALAAGERSAADVAAEAASRGISGKTLKRARRDLVVARKDGFGGGWILRLK
jgi:hypothetical protein